MRHSKIALSLFALCIIVVITQWTHFWWKRFFFSEVTCTEGAWDIQRYIHIKFNYIYGKSQWLAMCIEKFSSLTPWLNTIFQSSRNIEARTKKYIVSRPLHTAKEAGCFVFAHLINAHEFSQEISRRREENHSKIPLLFFLHNYIRWTKK